MRYDSDQGYSKIDQGELEAGLEKEGRLYRLKDDEAHFTAMEWHERYGHLPSKHLPTYLKLLDHCAPPLSNVKHASKAK